MTTPDLPSLPSGSAVAPSARRSWQQSLTLALLAVSALLAGVLVYHRVTNPLSLFGTAYPAGTPAPPLAGTGEDGQPLALSDFRGKTVAVFFGFLNCPNICPTTLAALERARPPIAWLVGGRDKGADLAPLIQAAQGRVRKVIAFGEDGEALARGLGLPYETVSGQGGDEVMHSATRAALHALDGEGTVLLAPIGTSFDLFRDYKARGESFTRAARALAGEDA